MKKMLFAAAAMMAAMTANAVGFDYTTTSIYDLDLATVFTELNNVTIQETSAAVSPAVTGKNSLNLVDAGEASFSMGGVIWSYTNSTAGTTIAKQYGNYVQPNGKDRKITIPTTPGDVVTITLAADAALDVIDGADVTTSASAATHTLTAKSTSIVITTTTSKPKFSAITVGAATAANDAEADAEFAYSVKINGQKVNAKVYNEPVIEVSSNGSAKVVINKK